MSFKVVVKGKDKLFRDIEKALNSTLKLTVMQNLGRFARDIIYKRTKSGKGVSSDTEQRPTLKGLKALSPNYKKYRSKLAEKGFKFGSNGTTGKSNLTLTGQMLEAIRIEARRNGFRLDIKDDTREDGKNTNRQIAQYVAEERPFMALTGPEQTQVLREMESKLRAELKKSLGSRSVRT